MRRVLFLIFVGLMCVGCNNNQQVTVLKMDPKPAVPPPQQNVPGNPPMANPVVAPAPPDKKVMPNQSLRGRIYRVERQNELRNIGQFFQQYALEFQPNQRSLEGFKSYIKQAGPIYQTVSEGYYIVNIKARLSGDSVVAYESLDEIDSHMAVWGDGRVEKVLISNLKKALQ